MVFSLGHHHGLTRKERGGDAFMVIECDDAPGGEVEKELCGLDWMRWVRLVDKVAGGT